MANPVRVTYEGGDKLNRYLLTLASRLGPGGEIRVGFQNGATYPAEQGGLVVAQVAFWNEYGTKFAPARPFFRNMIEDQAPTWGRKLGAAVRYAGGRTRTALEILGADMNGHLKESIRLLEDPPLALSTIERRRERYANKSGGNSGTIAKPLIDTAVMIRSTTWVVLTGAPTK